MNFSLKNTTKNSILFFDQLQFNSKPLWFLLRREPVYHKLQYSKTPKYDPMAAFLGAAFGAFVVYFSLSSFGTNGSDLSDLTIVIWYTFLVLIFLKLFLKISTSSIFMGINFMFLYYYIVIFLFFLVIRIFFFLKTYLIFYKNSF